MSRRQEDLVFVHDLQTGDEGDEEITFNKPSKASKAGWFWCGRTRGTAPYRPGRNRQPRRIKQRGYLLYGFNGERPYNYMDAEGNLVGSEIDIARAVASEMGIEAVQGVAMNFDSFIPAILAGRIDTCLPIFVKPARCEKIQYATPHLIEGQSCIVASGNPKGIHGWDDLVSKDVKVGLVAGTTPNEIAKRRASPTRRSPGSPTPLRSRLACRVAA